MSSKIIDINNRLIIRWMDWNLINLKFNNPYDTKPLLLLMLSWSKKNIDNINELMTKYDLILLTNTYDEIEYYKTKYNCNIFYCNHNAFLNENLFKIDPSIIKKYNLVVNSRFIKKKKLYLADRIGKNNLLFIGYFTGPENEYTLPDIATYVNFKNNIIDKNNYNRLSTDKVVNYLNQSKVGGIFSEIEGACFASSEYLLCGLPVVSSKSIGGRDIWYNIDNSIICDANSDSVFDSVNLALKKIEDGSFCAEKIRENHIKLQEDFRINLTKYIISLPGYNDIDFNILKKELSN
jgi:glycosyltransferase involved in cell wall biosynthesis